MPGFNSTFNLKPGVATRSLEVRQIAASSLTNVVWPGESFTARYHITNRSSNPVRMKGIWRVVRYGTSVREGDIWVPYVSKLGQANGPIQELALEGRASTTLNVTLPIGRAYGGYGIVLDLGKDGALWAGTAARVLQPDSGRAYEPAYAMDMPWPHEISEPVMRTFLKLGIKGCRMGLSYHPVDSQANRDSMAEMDRWMRWCAENEITVMLTIGAGSAPQPLGRGRPWLQPDDTLIEGVKEDLAWLPQYDDDFRNWTRLICERWGWPKGPINGVELWNEPWEGVSISGWGADLPRYREMYRKMGEGVLEARKAGVKVLIGGASSSSNTLDKLFPTESTEFLPLLDFVSIHYQGPGATPCLVPLWMDRTGEYGRVRVWDTESWVANSEDRVAGVVASMLSFGQDRAMGTYGGNVYSPESHDVSDRNYRVAQVWSMAPAVAAAAKFIGQRKFQGLLFSQGLPWVYRFGGLKGPEDGTVVVLGNMGTIYNPNLTLYRSAQRNLRNGRLVIAADRAFRMIDFNGNPLPAVNGRLVVPLSGRGYYLRTDGSDGSTARLQRALRRSRIEGYPPVEIVAKDPVTSPATALRVDLVNVLNRAIKGRLIGTFNGKPIRSVLVAIGPNATASLSLPLSNVRTTPSNLYPLALTFDAGIDGSAALRETMRINQIARRNIVVDGNLQDWNGVLPQTISGEGLKASLTEEAWLPFRQRAQKVGQSLSSGYLAYNSQGFFFAARIQDPTPWPGGIRFENRDDDSYYYPAVSYQRGGAQTNFSVRWTGTVRAPLTGEYEFATVTDDGARLWVNGQPLIDAWRDQAPTEYRGLIRLQAGQEVPIRFEYFQGGGGASARLLWTVPGAAQRPIPADALPGGLRAEYFADRDLASKIGESTEPNVDHQAFSDLFPSPKAMPRDRHPLNWPDGVRRFSYRKDPDLPAGIGTDNVQIAFNVLPPDRKYWRSHPKGVMPRYMMYPDTDYEYALNTVAAAHGGGTEIWRLQAPGTPRKHFYPRQPKANVDGGPVKSGKLVTRRQGQVRVVEMFLPWTEIPEVKRCLDTGQPIKFSFRVNDNDGPAYELAQGRSVSKENNLAFHNDWVTHWANELEFAFARR
jgi:hypothetical protein